jgi:hypothetical protein
MIWFKEMLNDFDVKFEELKLQRSYVSKQSELGADARVGK